MRGDRTFSSIIAYTDDEEILVGQNAKRRCNQTNLFAVKRLIGRRFKDEAAKGYQDGPYSIAEASNGDAWIDVKGEKLHCPRFLQKF